MKLKNAVVYRYKNLAPFFLAVLILSVIQSVVLGRQEDVSNIDFIFLIAKCAFIFAFGVMSFKQPYKYLLQNEYKSTGIYVSFILTLPITLIYSLLSTLASYLLRGNNDFITYMFSHGRYEWNGAGEIFTFLTFKTVASASLFALMLLTGHVVAMALYRLSGKLSALLTVVLGAVTVLVPAVLLMICDMNGNINTFSAAITFLLIPLILLIFSFGLFLSTHIELERSKGI